jgi:ribA/ribD-fused uncharacterized protein
MTEIGTRLHVMEFQGAYRFLSNFYPSQIVDAAGTEWPTVEHYFQAMKCVDPGNVSAIRLAARPGVAKQIGRSIQLRPDWEEVKDSVMYAGLRAKFAPGTELANMLLWTNDAILVEGNVWHDQYWGDCRCNEQLANPRSGCLTPGENKLGLLLMVVRDELRGA